MLPGLTISAPPQGVQNSIGNSVLPQLSIGSTTANKKWFKKFITIYYYSAQNLAFILPVHKKG